jgi:tetratricopeptide (TPR) repeat protein
MKRLIGLCVAIVLLPAAGRAGGLKDKADAAWAARDDVKQTLLAFELYEQLAKQNPNDFESRIRMARAAYWAMEELEADLSKNEKIDMYDRAIRACNEVIEKDPENVAAWHWLIWDMGALTLVKGVFSGWNLREGIVGTIMVAKNDVEFHHGSVYLYWGRVVYETPGLMAKFLHFADEDSLWLYGKAIEIEPDYLRAHIFMAETYEKLGRKEEAKKEYRFCVDLPEDALPGMEPENRLYKKLAAERLKDL